MDKTGVQSVERTFTIIEALSQYPKGAFLSELAAATSLNKTTVHRLLNSLISLGYAAQENESSKYFLTFKMFEIGGRIVRKHDILSQTKPFLERLSSIAGEAVHLVVREGTEILYVFKEDSGDNTVRMSSRVGLRSPMYCTAVGKAIMAELPEAEAEEIWNSSVITRRTGKTITTLEELRKQLSEVRKKGYAVDDEENEVGVRCVGASICDSSGKVYGAFSVSVPVSRMDDKRLKAIAGLVLQIKKEIILLTGEGI